MPFKSQQQARWMFSQKPQMAKQWADETPDIKKLPKKVKSTSTKRKSRMFKSKASPTHTHRVHHPYEKNAFKMPYGRKASSSSSLSKYG